MRLVVNPHADLRARQPEVGERAHCFHRSLPGYAPTPLHDLPRLAHRLGIGRLLVKDESARFGLPAFKILGASFALARMIEERLQGTRELLGTSLEELARGAREAGVSRLVTASDGNHGRGVARVARWLGLEARVFMPGSTVPARSEAIAGEGADVVVIEGVYDEAVRRASRDAGDEGALLVQDTAWEGYEEVPARIVEGYSTMMREIDEALDPRRDTIDLVVVPVGVGSLAEAVARHLRARGRARVPRLCSVEPLGAACLLAALERDAVVAVERSEPTMMAGLDCGTLSTTSWPVLKRTVDVALAIEDGYAAEAMRALAAEGIVAGESGAAALGALLASLDEPALREALALSEESTVLVLSTEGATDPENHASITFGSGH